MVTGNFFGGMDFMWKGDILFFFNFQYIERKYFLGQLKESYQLKIKKATTQTKGTTIMSQEFSAVEKQMKCV